jgi:hypothetical protein
VRWTVVDSRRTPVPTAGPLLRRTTIQQPTRSLRNAALHGLLQLLQSQLTAMTHMSSCRHTFEFDMHSAAKLPVVPVMCYRWRRSASPPSWAARHKPVLLHCDYVRPGAPDATPNLCPWLGLNACHYLRPGSGPISPKLCPSEHTCRAKCVACCLSQIFRVYHPQSVVIEVLEWSRRTCDYLHVLLARCPPTAHVYIKHA